MDTQSTDLKPVERAALIALATAGGRLHESTDLRQRIGLSFTREHRTRLKERNLVRSQKKSVKSLELTDEGWAWAETELRGPRPGGVMGFGALYTVLGELDRVLRGRDESLRGFFGSEGGARAGDSADAGLRDKGIAAAAPEADTGPGISYQDRIGEAAWAEADGALATAMQDMPAFGRMLARARALSETDRSSQYSRVLEQLEGAAEQVFQSVRRAGSRRDLEVLNVRGDKLPFDATAYDVPFDLRQGALVEVIKPAVVRRDDHNQQVILRGVADPC